MQETPAATLDRRTVHQARVFTITCDRVRLPNGHETTMDVVRHVRSVILIPMPDPEHVVLVRQYRYVIDRWIWELPAGNTEPGEEPDVSARRECAEETGQVPSSVERLGSFYPTPGYCDEQMIFYKLTGLTPAPDARLDPDELLARVVTVPLSLTIFRIL